jgi:hypothetical protein
MRIRMIIGGLAVVATASALPAWAAAASAPGPVPSACVVINGPAGANVQVGYAPIGPDGCTTLP